jgi:cytochrome c biogenesis protein CcmG/thiol:disulfide interchange protein DsbE
VLLALVAFMGLLGYRLVNPPGSGPGLGAPGINAEGRLGSAAREPATDFTLQGFDGEAIKLSDFRGKVVVLNFWSSWCQPCKDEAQVLEQVSRQYRGKGVVVLGANVWTSDQDARNFLDEYGITYPNGSTHSGLAAEYGLTGIPETFIIDADGTIVRRWLGPLSAKQLTGLLQAALPPASAGK